MVDNAIEVLRGVLGSRINEHKQSSHLRKIKPLPIEFRRPSILRASGHTFEYVGYGQVTIQLHYLNYRIEHYQ